MSTETSPVESEPAWPDRGSAVPATDDPGTDLPGTDVPGTDVPATDVPATDVPGTDVPGTDVPGTDVPGTDVPGTDVGGTEGAASSGSVTAVAPVAPTDGSSETNAEAGEQTSATRFGTAPGVRLVVVTGMSGAGRSTAANALEDLGWYVVDNLPPSVLPEMCALAAQSGWDRLAVVLDVRTRSFFEQLPSMFSELRAEGVRPEILFLEASDDVIVRRQESVRRPHPLQGDGRLLDGILAERASLATLRAAADLVIDTSSINIHQLASRVSYAYGDREHDQLRVTVLSFGFKNGIPVDADLVVDVRFLPNPHWVPELRPQTGLSPDVSAYVLGQDGAEEFLTQLGGLLRVTAEGYIREGKRFATVAIGCTGGKHRSTAMAEEFARRLRAEGVPTKVLHRDVGRG